MKNRKEIKFRTDQYGLVSHQNGMIFRINEIPMADKTAPYIVSAYDVADPKKGFTTCGYRYFSLDAAKEFCQQVSTGEIDLKRPLAEFVAEDEEKERAAVLETTERAKNFHALLDANGLKYSDLLNLTVLAHSLGDMGHHILMAYERGEGWPSGT